MEICVLLEISSFNTGANLFHTYLCKIGKEHLSSNRRLNTLTQLNHEVGVKTVKYFEL